MILWLNLVSTKKSVVKEHSKKSNDKCRPMYFNYSEWKRNLDFSHYTHPFQYRFLSLGLVPELQMGISRKNIKLILNYSTALWNLPSTFSIGCFTLNFSRALFVPACYSYWYSGIQRISQHYIKCYTALIWKENDTHDSLAPGDNMMLPGLGSTIITKHQWKSRENIVFSV